ncbi:MAG: type II secretion system minor pseudopilin GspI [Candidatus Sphingomonas colombiensis]|nr:type II secretion system minor pseudopilin GspI [Sphingomonas sp.]WEK43441.1 MAG: type II secretion system minor pseudopilin GspI [Sphingomonas sp.]
MCSRRSAEHGFTCSRRSAEHGFTLIEIMVALIVFSLAALALIRLEGATIRSTGVLDTTLLAQTVARNIAIEAVTDAAPPPAGKAEGTEHNGGADWHWVRQVSAIGDGQVMRVDVSVAGRDGRQISHLTMVRPTADAAR